MQCAGRGRTVGAMPGKGRQEPEVYRITGAAQAHSQDLDQRIGKYLVSMLIRTVCVILALVVPGPLRWVFAAGAVFLPYVAVVMANAGGDRRGTAPATITVPSSRAGLTAAPPRPVAEEPLEGTVLFDEPRDRQREDDDAPAERSDRDDLAGEVDEPRRTVA